MSFLVDVNFVQLLCDGYLRQHFLNIRIDDISKIVSTYAISYHFVPLHNKDISSVAVGFEKDSSSPNYYCKFRSKRVTNTSKCNYTKSTEALKTTMIFKPFLSQILQSHYNQNRKPTVNTNPIQPKQFFQTIAFDIKLTQCDCGAKCFANNGYIIQVGVLRIPNILMLHHFLESDNDGTKKPDLLSTVGSGCDNFGR